MSLDRDWFQLAPSERRRYVQQQKELHPRHVAVICTPSRTVLQRLIGNGEPPVPVKRCLIDQEMTVAQYMMLMRKQIKLTSEQSMYLFVGHPTGQNHTLPSATATFGRLYAEHKTEDDGVLYITYALENTFG